MNKLLSLNDRRNFLKKCSLAALPLGVSTMAHGALPSLTKNNIKESSKTINFIYDGLAFLPEDYLQILGEIHDGSPIQPDYYGNGGSTKNLEETFAKLTGKDKAIYLPTGTMANQLAVKLLNGHNAKVIVPENSHVFRDEADAAQSVHSKRLIPVGKGKAYFDVNDLTATIDYTNKNEVFKSGLGTVVIENPVRRAQGTAIPLESIKSISSYCRENGYKLHLDGARLHIASAFTGISLAEYASYFDTVYISLYKYLNAAGGAMLCGDAELIDQIPHQIKIYGGSVFQSWLNTSVALHYLNGIEERWAEVVRKSKLLMDVLNKIPEVEIIPVSNGTNIYNFSLLPKINSSLLAEKLNKDHNIWIGQADGAGNLRFAVNESILSQDLAETIGAFKSTIQYAKI